MPFEKKRMHFALKRYTKGFLSKADAVSVIAVVSEGKELDLKRKKNRYHNNDGSVKAGINVR